MPFIQTCILFSTFKIKTLKDFVKKSIAFYAITFIIAGIFLYTNENYFKSIIFSIAMLEFVFLSLKHYKSQKVLKNYIGNLRLNVLNQEINLKALIDTGNNLSSHYDEEIIILSLNCVSSIKDKYAREILQNKVMPNYENNNIDVKLIAFSSLGNKFDSTYGIEIGNAKLMYEKNTYNKKSILISANENFENYDAIVSLKFIEEKNKEDSNGNIVNHERKSKEIV